MSFFLKTSQVLQASLMGLPLEIFSGRLPQSGSMRNGHIYALLMQARRTAGSDGSAWPTPLANDAINRPNSNAPTKLSARIHMKWPTPNTFDAIAPRSEEAMRRQFSTARKGRTAPANLREAIHPNLYPDALWPTPLTNDAKNATLPPSHAEWDSLPGEMIRQGVQGSLNPAWVEMLQGYPSGWTDISSPPHQVPPNIQQSRRALRRMRKTAPKGSRRSAMRLSHK